MKSPERGPSNAGMFAAIDEMKREQEALAKSLEGLPFEQEHFSVTELNKVIEIRKALDEIIQQSKSGENQPGEYLSEAIQYLDSLDTWIFKFGTGDVGHTEETDSMYYVMPTGISLRLKRSNLVRGIRDVIQPFMESIVFINNAGRHTEHLKIDSVPLEHCSREFYDLQNRDHADQEFISKVKKYYKGDKLQRIIPPENLFHEHPGNPINHIYWSKI